MTKLNKAIENYSKSHKNELIIVEVNAICKNGEETEFIEISGQNFFFRLNITSIKDEEKLIEQIFNLLNNLE